MKKPKNQEKPEPRPAKGKLSLEDIAKLPMSERLRYMREQQ